MIFFNQTYKIISQNTRGGVLGWKTKFCEKKMGWSAICSNGMSKLVLLPANSRFLTTNLHWKTGYTEKH